MSNIKQLPRSKVIVAVLIFLLGLSTVAVAQKKASIEIAYEVKVDAQDLRLADIAEIKAASGVKKELQKVNLGEAPLPGYTRVLKKDYILSSLKRAGFNLGQLNYQIPGQIRITTRYQILDSERLIKEARNYIYQSLDFKSEDIEINFQKTSNEIKLPVGQVKLQVGNVNARTLLGRTVIPMNIYVNGKLAKKKQLQVNVTAYQKVLVAKDLIKRHQTLSEDVFKWERREMSNLYGNQPFTDLASIQDFRLKRTINPGQVLTKQMIELPPLVKRRKEVTIIANIGGVEVKTKGIALESGIKGKIIKVKNANSGKELMAKVWAKDTVKVIL